MTTTQPSPLPFVSLKELWADERINALINEILSTSAHTPRGLARRVSYTVRDDYEAKLDEYQAVILHYVVWSQEYEAKLAQLEAELDEARQTISIAQLRIGHYSTIVKELTDKIDFDHKSLMKYTDLHGHGDDDDSTTT